MKKSKRIFASIGAICLILLYISTLIFAFIDTTTSLVYLKTSIGATIFFPVILYVMTVISKSNNQDDTSDALDETDTQE